jgi:hypothetical protein
MGTVRNSEFIYDKYNVVSMFSDLVVLSRMGVRFGPVYLNKNCTDCIC